MGKVLIKNIGCLQTPVGSYSHKGSKQGANEVHGTTGQQERHSTSHQCHQDADDDHCPKGFVPAAGNRPEE